MLRPSIVAAGLNPDSLSEDVTPEQAQALFSGSRSSFETPAAPRRWRDVWSAGHSVSGVQAVESVKQVIEATHAEYCAAMQRSLADIHATLPDCAVDATGAPI